MLPSQMLVEKRKFDGTLWGSYAVFTLQQSSLRQAFWQPRGTFINRNHGWTMRNDHLQFFYPGCWYAISASYTHRGQLSHCYCDIVMPWDPPQSGATAMRFIDLELDLHAEPTRFYRIYDEEEFALAVAQMHYPEEIRLGAAQALQDLIDALLAWREPFASLPLALPRTDLHRLDTSSRAWRDALTALGL
jgi:protein associated with RNAse G/E